MNVVHIPSRLRNIIPYIKEEKFSYLLAFVLLFVGSMLTAAKAWIIQPAVDRVIEGPVGVSMLWFMCGVVAFIFIAHAVIEWLFLIVSKSATVRVSRKIRGDLFSSLIGNNLGFFVKNPSSDLISRMINDVSMLEVSALNAFMGLVRSTVTLVMLLGVMIYQDAQLGLACAAVMLVAGFLLRYAAKFIAVHGARIQRKLSRVVNQLSEMINGMELILGFGLADQWREKFSRVNHGYCTAQVRGIKVNSSPAIIIQLIAGITLAVVLLIMGQALLRGEINELGIINERLSDQERRREINFHGIEPTPDDR